MSTHQSLVRAFHEKFNIPVRDKPGVPSDERVRLRLRLIAEEFFELLDACLPDADNDEHVSEARVLVRDAIAMLPVSVDLPEAVDALADLEYVIAGSACEFGVDMGPVFAEVHRSNMTKEGGGERSDGKIQKPPGWVAPDVEGVLRAQGYEREE